LTRPQVEEFEVATGGWVTGHVLVIDGGLTATTR
jgi:hypothetical protein